MSEPKSRVLFTVHQMMPVNGGEPYCFVDWDSDIAACLDDIAPNYHYTDKLIDLAEEILGSMDQDDETS